MALGKFLHIRIGRHKNGIMRFCCRTNYWIRTSLGQPAVVEKNNVMTRDRKSATNRYRNPLIQ